MKVAAENNVFACWPYRRMFAVKKMETVSTLKVKPPLSPPD